MKRVIRWTIIVAMLIAAIGIMAPVSAQTDAVELQIEGVVEIVEDELVVVTGVVVAVEGETDDFAVGDEVTLLVAPAGAFAPGQLEEGADVLLTGVLLPDDETLKATALEVVEEEEEPVVDEECEDPESEECEEPVVDEEPGDEECEDPESEECEEPEEEFETCVGTEEHPVGQRLADAYGLEYETVMEWFCSGLGFGEIKLGLALAEAADMDPDDVFAMRDEMGWGQIMKELDLKLKDLTGVEDEDEEGEEAGEETGEGGPPDSPPGLEDHPHGGPPGQTGDTPADGAPPPGQAKDKGKGKDK